MTQQSTYYAKASYSYSDFGETETKGDADFYNEIAYTDGIYDNISSLYYLNARYYNPEDGRFITQDTYRGENNEPNTLHLYAYCANNPINYIDLNGHWKINFKFNWNFNKPKAGKWEIVKYLGKKSKKIKNTYKRERAILLISWGLGKVTSGGITLLGIAESIYREKCYDVNKYGGVFTKTYYRRQITNINNKKTNVPVPYRFEYITYFYSSDKFKKIVYTERIGDGIRLANN